MALIRKPLYEKKVNLLIIGAGNAGKLIAEHILKNPKLNYNIIGFIDDDLNKKFQNFKEIPVLGTTSEIKLLSEKHNINEILIAMPSIEGLLIRKIFYICKPLNLPIKILPSSFNKLEWIEKGIMGFKKIRPLEIEDFFRKKPVISDLEKVKVFFKNKTILITGAAGSIGSELCNQILEFNPEKLIALDIAETPLHNLMINTKKQYSEKFIPIIADINNKPKLKKIFSEYNPSIIFHAAAYKHVPMMEINPEEAAKNNVFATKTLIESSEEFNVSNFILISTDKAVNPTNAMGASKKITELMIQTKKSQTKFISVRFGNVVNSQGSVIPLFKKQIEKSEPLTVTHPDIKRFFMSIPEAVSLIIQSPIIGENKDLFILDMGEQIKITQIAEDMINLAGFQPNKDIEIKFIGLREGEKLLEELHTKDEKLLSTSNKRIFKIKPKEVNKDSFEDSLNELKTLLDLGEKQQIKKKLIEIASEENNSERKFLPYFSPLINEPEKEEILDSINKGWLTMGPKTIEFEKQLADYLKVKHIIALNSCTAGLHLSLIALGIKKEDEIITTPFTFAATANVICHVGAKPVFVDINETFNMNPDKIEQAITPNTKAILVVHYGGQAANLDKIEKIAKKHNLKIIEDAAHAIGSEYNGKKIGYSGNLTCFSFYVTKNMTTGEGGAIATNDDVLAEKLKILRLHGMSKNAWNRYSEKGSWYYEIKECGWKYNMTDLQAAMGIHQLKKLDNFIKKRQELAKIYNKELSQIPEIKIPLITQTNTNPVYHLYPILLKTYNRNKFIEELKKRKIGTSVHFIPLHLQPFYKKTFNYKEGDFPIAEEVYSKLVTLPLYPKMTNEDVKYVVNSIREILKNKKTFELREVKKEDSRDIHEWRNHPVARVASRNTKEIPYEEHLKWFDSVLKDPDRKIYLAVDKNEKIGQVRFDKKQNNNAEISITLNPKKYGKGYSSKILKQAIKKYFNEEKEITKLIAEIRQENLPSIKIFQKAGFIKIKDRGEWIGFQLKNEHT